MWSGWGPTFPSAPAASGAHLSPNLGLAERASEHVHFGVGREPRWSTRWWAAAAAAAAAVAAAATAPPQPPPACTPCTFAAAHSHPPVPRTNHVSVHCTARSGAGRSKDREAGPEACSAPHSSMALPVCSQWAPPRPPWQRSRSLSTARSHPPALASRTWAHGIARSDAGRYRDGEERP